MTRNISLDPKDEVGICLVILRKSWSIEKLVNNSFVGLKRQVNNFAVFATDIGDCFVIFLTSR